VSRRLQPWKKFGHVRVSAIAPTVGHSCRAVMGTVVSTAVIVVLSTVLLTPVSQALRLSADSTALILGRTSVPTPDDAYVEIVKNQYIVPTHRGQDIIYIPVATPQEFWPLSALLFRLPGLTLGPGEIWGPGGPGWPDEPWWKLSGLFDLTINQSLRAGVTDLEQAMAKAGNDNLVIYGYSQGAGVANLEKRKLAEQYPVGTKAPDIDFVLGGDPNLPNGGVASRFAGLYLIRPEHNPVGPFDFAGVYDERSDRRYTIPELVDRGYEDAYRQFIDPVIGASGERIQSVTTS